jgi:Mg-chelatase subunit ChlD
VNVSLRKGTLISIGKGDEKRIVADSGPAIKIQGKLVGREGGRGVDLVFVIDTTGSMSDKIEGLLATCTRFVDEFAALNLDQRVAIVAFGDLTVPGDKIETTAFTGQVEIIKRSLQNIPRYGGGGNEGESSLEALEKALALPFRPNVVKVVILITDEPALQHQIRASDMINRLSTREFLAFVVSPPLAYFQEMANRNGGKWYQVEANTDFTDLLAMFKQMAEKVSQVVSDVYHMGGGSVANYLRIKPPEE